MGKRGWIADYLNGVVTCDEGCQRKPLQFRRAFSLVSQRISRCWYQNVPCHKDKNQFISGNSVWYWRDTKAAVGAGREDSKCPAAAAVLECLQMNKELLYGTFEEYKLQGSIIVSL